MWSVFSLPSRKKPAGTGREATEKPPVLLLAMIRDSFDLTGLFVPRIIENGPAYCLPDFPYL